MADLAQDVISRLTQPLPADQKMKLLTNEIFTLTVAELRACCAKNPQHPHAPIFSNATNGHDGNEVIHVEKVTIEALLENKGVNVIRSVEKESYAGSEQESIVETKVLGDKLN